MRMIGMAACLGALVCSTALSPVHAADSKLTIALAAEPTTLNPIKYKGGVDQYGLTNMFERLLRVNAKGELVNWLAESWKITGTKENPVIEVAIRPGVKFHNGDPLTSADFEYAYTLQRDPALGIWAHLQASIERFEIVDDLHFKLHFKTPDATYVSGMLQLWAIPKAYYEKVGEAGFAQNPVGTGPWKFGEWKVKESLRLDRFEDYWNKDHHPGADVLDIKFIPDDLTRTAAYKTGEVDWIDAVPPAMVAEFKDMANTETASLVSGNNLFFALPTHLKTPFSDVRVRQAAAHAIDMDAIIKSVLFGQAERYAEIGRDSIGYDPDLAPYSYDPAKARALLAEAGYANGFDIPCYNLTTPREPNIKEMGEAAYAYLTSVGIRCRVEALEYSAWLALGRRAVDNASAMKGIYSFMYSHGIPGDPGTPWAGHLHSTQGSYGAYSYDNDPEIDQMVEEQRRIMDPAERAEYLKKIARIKHEQVLGGITTYRPLVTLAWRADKVNFAPWPDAYWRNFQEIGLK